MMLKSIRLKLLTLVVAVAVMVSGLMAASYIIYDTIQLKKEYEQEVRDLLRTIIRSTYNDLYTLDLRDLRVGLQGFLDVPGVKSIYVLDLDGRVLTDGTSENPLRRTTLSPSHFVAGSLPTTPDASITTSKGVIHASAASSVAGEDPIGYVHLDVSLEKHAIETRERLSLALIAAFLSILAGAAAAWHYSGRLSRPLVILTEAANDISLGLRERDIPTNGNDEISELGTSFKRMVDSLREKNASLLLAKEEAEKANRVKDDFMAAMSHELRTPLNAILGFAQLLESDASDQPDEKQKEYPLFIMRSGESLLHLIDQVLDLRNIEQEEFKPNFNHAYPYQVIQSSLRLASKGIDREDVEIINNVTKEHYPLIWTDAFRFQQVLVNLISNAIKYNKKNGKVVIDCHTIDDGFLRFSIRDTGYGIEADKRDRVFKPFDRLGREAGAIGGSGIGLTIAKEIIEKLGGHIGFESTPGEGTTFWADVPLSQIKSPPRAQSIL